MTALQAFEKVSKKIFLVGRESGESSMDHEVVVIEQLLLSSDMLSSIVAGRGVYVYLFNALGSGISISLALGPE